MLQNFISLLLSKQIPLQGFNKNQKSVFLMEKNVFPAIKAQRPGNLYSLNSRANSEKEHCYDDVCFAKFNFLGKKGVPSNPKIVDVKFLLYTIKHLDTPIYLLYDNLTLVKRSDFNVSAETQFIVHGFKSDCFKTYVQKIKEALLTVDSSSNVICVDWHSLTTDFNYAQAATDTQVVATMMVSFMKMINNELGNINNRTHFIGFSLGAQICGMAGGNLTGLKRISGLDPAGPIFNDLMEDKRLDKTDAKFVDVIHTNGGRRLNFGYLERAGHVDFYPNGGQSQAGCPGAVLIFFQTFFNPIRAIGCHHLRASDYFIESFNLSCQLIGFQCEDYENFMQGNCFSPDKMSAKQGYYSYESKANGSFYLITRTKFPFCGNQYLAGITVNTPTISKSSSQKIISLIFYDSQGMFEKVEIFRSQSKNGLTKIPIITKSESTLNNLSIIYEESTPSLSFINVSYVELTNVEGVYCKYVVNGSVLYEGKKVGLLPVI